MKYVQARKVWKFVALAIAGLLFSTGSPVTLRAQTGSTGTIAGTVKDPSGAAVANAEVEISYPVSGYQRTATTGSAGDFTFANVPFNPYHLSVTAAGFASYVQDVNLLSSVPVNLQIALKIGTSSTTVTVTESAGELLELTPSAHTDIDRQVFQDLPLESQSSSVSSLVTLATPGVAADSNGLFHGLGDHASNSFSVDGQAITDQQSKVFSNQIPEDSIQSLEVIAGAPTAEYGDKTSLVIKVTTRSGLDVKQPTGSITTSYGSFGTTTGGFNLAYGNDKIGNFISGSGLQSGRFLDPPEVAVFHDKGNQVNIFDRLDFKLSNVDAIQLNLQYTRSWFQTPNSYDSQLALPWVALDGGGAPIGPNGLLVGPADQRSQIKTFNVAPTWTRLIGTNTVFSLGGFARQDQYNYYPSDNPFADLGPPNLQRQSVSQSRKLTNVGAHTDVSWAKGAHAVKGGATYEQTFLYETDNLGIVDPTFNAPCVDDSDNPVAGFTATSQCAGAALFPNNSTNPNAGSVVPLFVPSLACYDLTRATPAPSDGCAGSAAMPYRFYGRTDVKELSLYGQDTINKGNWSFNIGVRGDFYNAITSARQAEPRLGVAYKIPKTNTVLRLSYAHTMETPFNENLVLSSVGCNDPVINAINTITTLSPCVTAPLRPGLRNEYHAGLQQAFGKYFVLDFELLWKYSSLAYDFSILGNTPITFPIEWQRSKIPGFTARGTFPEFHGLSAYFVLAHVAARFFGPQLSGIGATPTAPQGAVFRIDHDENLDATTHVQYKPWKRGPFFALNWRYDSGLVAGSVPFSDGVGSPVDLSSLTAGQEFEAGLFCGPLHATPTVALPTSCPNTTAMPYGSTLIKIPGTLANPAPENDDHNPQRIAPRNLFDLSAGEDDLFHSHNDRYKWSLRFTVINLTNKVALYNFLSTFSGTHYVTPRTETVELGFHF